jgi:hypothetical protein
MAETAALPWEADRPVALATCGHLDRALRPVEERVEHLRVEVPGGDRRFVEAVVRPHGIGRRCVILGQVLRSLARGDHLESRGATPIDHFADQRGLVAVRERVHDPRFARALREERARERVGLDVHHHDVLAVRAAGERVADASGGASRRVDHDFHVGGSDGARRVVGHERRAMACRVRERSRVIALSLPSDAGQRRSRTRGIEVRHRDDVNARRVLGLREIHRAELSRADHRDTQRTLRRGAFASMR